MSRITLAVEAGFPLPLQGAIAVVGARAGDDLSALPSDRLTLVQGFKPDVTYWQGRSLSVSTDFPAEFAGAIVILPRSKAQAMDQIARAVACGGPVWIDGMKTDGIDSVLKHCRARGTVTETLSKAHGKLFVLTGQADDFADWIAQPMQVAGMQTRVGVFSADRVDRGSELLAGCLPAAMKGRVADLGAGWGYLSAQVLAKEGVEELHLVEADHPALDCARTNIDDPRAQFFWDDATNFHERVVFNHVVCNPPFHVGRAADTDLGKAFLQTAARILAPSGTLWMVANRHLPYETTLTHLFREVEEIGGDRGFKVLKATRPVAQGRRKR